MCNWDERDDNGSDPTYVPVKTTAITDPLVKRMRGIAIHGNTPFDVPFISHIAGNLYQGGCENGLVLPLPIEHVLSLYKWERYTLHPNVKTFKEVTMYDSHGEPDRENVVALANLVVECIGKGPTLVHCQAGLNRSGLIAGAALMIMGLTSDEAIYALRGSRSPAVLCNRSFADWLRNFKP